MRVMGPNIPFDEITTYKYTSQNINILLKISFHLKLGYPKF